MSERSNDTPDDGPDDLSATTEPVAPPVTEVAAAPELEPAAAEVAAAPEVAVEAAAPEVAAAPVTEVEATPERDVEETATDRDDGGDEAAEGQNEGETGEGESESSLVETHAGHVDPEAGAPVRPMSPSERRAARSGLAHGQLPIDPALRIKDRASSIMVLLTVGVFVVIFLNALVLGQGGLLRPLPTLVPPTPITTPSPAATPVPTATTAPTASPAAS